MLEIGVLIVKTFLSNIFFAIFAYLMIINNKTIAISIKIIAHIYFCFFIYKIYNMRISRLVADIQIVDISRTSMLVVYILKLKAFYLIYF